MNIPNLIGKSCGVSLYIEEERHYDGARCVGTTTRAKVNNELCHPSELCGPLQLRTLAALCILAAQEIERAERRDEARRTKR